MKLPQEIIITYNPLDDGNWCNMELNAKYECSNEELLQYIEYAVEALKRVE